MSSDAIFFFVGSFLFLLGVIFALTGWLTWRKSKNQQEILRGWEADLTEWANTQQDNILTMQHSALSMQEELSVAQTTMTQMRSQLNETQEQLARRQAEIDAVRQEADTRALVLRNYDGEVARLERQLARVTQERDQIKADFAKFVDFLMEAGILKKNMDSLPSSSAELQEFYLHPPTIESGTLPSIPSLLPEQLHAALLHAAELAFSGHSNADKPFTRAYMVDQGPLSQPQLERLREAMVTQGYLVTKGKAAFELTERGWNLLKSIKVGTL